MSPPTSHTGGGHRDGRHTGGGHCDGFGHTGDIIRTGGGHRDGRHTGGGHCDGGRIPSHRDCASWPSAGRQAGRAACVRPAAGPRAQPQRRAAGAGGTS